MNKKHNNDSDIDSMAENGMDPVVNLTHLVHHGHEDIKKVLAEIALEDNPLHQYTADIGHPRLMQTVAKFYSPLVHREINPSDELLISSGATGALYLAIFGHIDKGDEVIVMEPFYKCYVPQILSAGGIPRFIALKPKTSHTEATIQSSDWILDYKELASFFNLKTKMIILNNPHSPLGKVFSREELEGIANLCKIHDVICLCDEALEWMVYGPDSHVRIASLPGMWDRTITVGSAGKAFLVTGWRVGWAYGSKAVIQNMKVAHQNSSYTPLQEAVARIISNEMTRYSSPDFYFSSVKRELQCKRDRFVNILSENGFEPTIPDAGYFMVANWTKKDNSACMTNIFKSTLARDARVITTDLSAFYTDVHKHYGDNYISICFLQEDETIAD